MFHSVVYFLNSGLTVYRACRVSPRVSFGNLVKSVFRVLFKSLRSRMVYRSQWE